MMRVLFVDDDTNILRSFKRLLMGMGKGIKGSFAEDGETALAMMEKQEFDVVVADMRMPTLSGAEVLAIVQEKYPGVVRIILSGQSEMNAMLDSVKPAHQFLSKPCTSEVILATLEQSMRLKTMLENETIRSNVAKIGSLPSLPDIYMEFMEEIEKDNYSIGKLGEIVTRDVGMTANLLKVINSSYFGLSRTIGTPAEAISYLGLDMVKALILGVHLFSEFKGGNEKTFSLPMLWGHSMRTAHAVKCLAEHEGCDKKSMAICYSAGMLHDVGKLILIDKFPEEYERVVTFVRQENIHIHAAEQEVLHCTHAEIGAYLLGLWGLPTEVVDAVAHHHHPSRSGVTTMKHPLALMHVANVLDHEMYVVNKGYAPHPLDEEFLANVDVTKEQLEGWMNICSYSTSEEAANA